MDQMDVDQVVEVPDTPDRFAKQGINGRSGVKVENHTSSLPFHGQQKLFEEGSRDQPMIIDSGSRGRSLHPPKRTSSPSNSRHLTTTASFSSPSSSSSRNTHIFRKGVSEKNPSVLSHDSMQKTHLQAMRPPHTAKYSSSSSQNDGFLDQTERSLPKTVIGNGSRSEVPGNNHGDFRRRLGNGSSSHSQTNLQIASSSTIEGTNNVGRVGSITAFREGVDFVGNGNKKPGDGGFRSLDPIASPRVSKQKRLVRNGCISPSNIAKAKQLVGKDNNRSVAVAHNSGSVASSAPPISTDIREIVADDSDAHTRKGKGVISRPCSSKEPDLHNRCSMSLNEKAMEMIDFSRGTSRSIEESGGWRNTRHRTREIRMPSPDKEHCLIREREAPRNPTQHHESRLERRQKGISVASSDDYFKDPSFTSTEHVRPLRESVSHPRGRLGRQPNGPRSAADSLMKRQKQGSTSSSRGECSTSVSADPEVVFLSSTAEAGRSKSTSNNVGNSQQIIEVDELSPQLRRNAHDEDTRAMQVEADELLARELQEQFYNEVPIIGEVDEHLALALQHQEGSNHSLSRARRPVSDPRLMSHLHRQPPSRSSSSSPRRGAVARSSSLGRMTRLRSRFPGQPRTLLPSRGRTSIFPPDMDVDMRMHILGALEEFSDMGVSARILQPDRDFNEDDYEMLLALDENNHQHGGASIHRINGLPESTVQSDNFEEVCAVCLDTPTIGDTIRHLPCLHKFHKDCIDPWLRRRTSCPVCKSSIT